jgi:3D (Asp-Asp-Asp) domain-containing protein/peptidoglycan hydrolase CwlO-like protein
MCNVPRVPGQAHPAALRLLGICAAAFLAVALPAFASPNAPRTASALRLANAQLEAKSRSATLSLYSLDARIAGADARLATLRGELDRLKAQRVVLRRELLAARLGERISERQLASRIRQLYDQGELSPLEVVFGASSIADALTQLDDMRSVASLNDDVLGQLHAARARTLTASRTLAARTRQLAAAVQSAAVTEASLAEARAAQAAYIARLATQRDLNSTQIGRLEAAASAAQARAVQLVHAPPAAAVATPAGPALSSPLAGGRTLTVTVSGYALGGRTATGLPVGWGVAAVDPNVIPLGTHLWVPGYGEAVAADVGGAIIGDRVDLWFPSVPQAEGWGLRTVTISLH